VIIALLARIAERNSGNQRVRTNTPSSAQSGKRSGCDRSLPHRFHFADNRTSPDAARAFVNQVHAAAKGYTAIEGGHFACLTNPTGFLNALDSDMRSLGIPVIKNIGEPAQSD